MDIIEIGVPFSDPLADGVVNQLASSRALASGTTLNGVLECVRAIRTESHPDLTFPSRVAWIEPRVDEGTRTAKVRIEFEPASEEVSIPFFRVVD